jgi:hypothetical protein
MAKCGERCLLKEQCNASYGLDCVLFTCTPDPISMLKTSAASLIMCGLKEANFKNLAGDMKALYALGNNLDDKHVGDLLHNMKDYLKCLV